MELSNAQTRTLKGKAQAMEPMLKIGKAGLSEGFLKTVNEALDQHELVKVKFAEFKEQKKQMAPLLAEKTMSRLVHRVGNVAVLYRQHSDPERRKVLV